MKPLRMCVTCKRRAEKSELIKLTKPKDKDATVASGEYGRGAYVCKNADCIAKAIKGRRFNYALKCNIPQQELDTLLLAINEEE